MTDGRIESRREAHRSRTTDAAASAADYPLVPVANSRHFRTDDTGPRCAPPGGSVVEAPGASGSGDGTSAPVRLLLRLAHRQEFAFLIVGAVNTGMGIGLTVAWLAALGDSVPPSVAVAAAYVTGIGIAFVLHRRLVFRVRGRVVRDFLGFAAVNSGGMVANAALLELAVTVLGFARTPAAVVVMGAVAAGTFFGHRYISFRRPVV